LIQVNKSLKNFKSQASIASTLLHMDDQWLDSPQEWMHCTSTLSSQEVLNELHLKDHASPLLKTRVQILGMYCPACALNIEEALSAIHGVQEARVSLSANSGTIYWRQSDCKPSQWLAAIKGLGYQAFLMESDDARRAQLKEQKDLFWRLMVAVLCMMQVMMYSVPTYDTNLLDLSAEMTQLLRMASWILCIPVVIFSCMPFWQGALSSLVQWRLSMDLPVAIGMAIAFALSTAVTLEPNGFWGHEIYFDSFSMFVSFLLLGRWLELKMRERTYGALNAIITSIPEGIQRQIGLDQYEQVSARRLQVADIIKVESLQTLPSDGILKSTEAWVEEALLSGESSPIKKEAGEALLMGSTNLGSAMIMEITKRPEDTRFSQIIDLLEKAQASKPRFVKLADQISRPFIAVVLLLALICAIFAWHLGPSTALITACSVLIVTCPCALTLSVPAAILASMGSLAKRGLLIKDTNTLEKLNHIDTIVFDKTGTLTQAQHQLQNAHFQPSHPLSMAMQLALARTLAKASSHPLSQSLCTFEVSQLLDAQQCKEFQLLQPQLHLKDRLETPGEGIQASIEFQDRVLHLRLGSAKLMDPADRSDENPIALSQVHLADENGWLCAFHFDETPKPQAKQLIQTLQAQAYQLFILSGDQTSRVQKLASELGLESERALGELSPKDKLDFLKDLQLKGHKVMMVGDGFNDLPVLSGSDVSVVFANATHNALSVSDCVILNPHLEALLRLFDQSQQTLRVVHQNLFWAIAYNLSCIPLAFLGWLSPWQAGLGMTLSSLLVVFNSLRLSPKEAEGDISQSIQLSNPRA
jgi:Cu2+-exporting ATPase